MNAAAKRLKVYGIIELAAAIRTPPAKVRQWLHHGNMGIPEPTERLARGAVWIAADIEEWISARQGRLAQVELRAALARLEELS